MREKPQGYRAHWHDYQAPGQYMITLMKSKTAPAFCSIDYNLQVKLWKEGKRFCTHWTRLGMTIAENLNFINDLHPAIIRKSYVIMPDHIHILIQVMERLEIPLGNIIARLKVKINQEANCEPVFAPGFNDQIIAHWRDLNSIYEYIKANPYRLAVRRLRPHYFRKYRGLIISGYEMQVFGNPFLLRNPFIYSLVIHRSDSEEIINRKKYLCAYAATNGGVVASAFISPKEKELRRYIENLGGRIILIHNRIFGDREKPEKHNFELCCEGRMLMLCPTTIANPAGSDFISREQCLIMNEIAESLEKQATQGLIIKTPENIANPTL